MSESVATQLLQILAQDGIRRVLGVVGDSLNGTTEALRRQSDIAWVHVRHEEVKRSSISRPQTYGVDRQSP